MPTNCEVGKLEASLNKLGYYTTSDKIYHWNYINSNGISYWFTKKPVYSNDSNINSFLIEKFNPESFLNLASIKFEEPIEPLSAARIFNAHSRKNEKQRLVGYKLAKNFPFSNLKVGQEFRIYDGYLYDLEDGKLTIKRNITVEEVQLKYGHLFEELYEEIPLEITHVVMHTGSGFDTASFDVIIKKEGIYFDNEYLIKIDELEYILKDIPLKNLTYSGNGFGNKQWPVSFDKITIGCKNDIPVQTIKNIIDIYNKNFK